LTFFKKDKRFNLAKFVFKERNAMKKKLVDKILSTCLKKLSKHPELKNFPHYSFVIKDGVLVSWATNSKKEPPRHYGYHRNWDKGFRPKWHSELAAYRKSPVKPPFQIVNVRMNKQGDLRISKPCAACTKMMTALGCSKFYYSFPGGFLSYVPREASIIKRSARGKTKMLEKDF
jgi:hypothetical protein